MSTAIQQQVQTQTAPSMSAVVPPVRLGWWRAEVFVLVVAVPSGLAGAFFGLQAGRLYGYACTRHSHWDPPVRAFLTDAGLQLGAIFGAVVALGYCRRMLRIVRQSELRLGLGQMGYLGARLGAFFGLISTLLLHGSLWVVGGFVAQHKPSESYGITLILLGGACALAAGLVLGWLCGAMGWLIFRSRAGKAGVVACSAPPAALRVDMRRAMPIVIAIAGASAATGCAFGGLAGYGYLLEKYQFPAMGIFYNNPRLMASGLAYEMVDAASNRPFLRPVGMAAGLGSGLVVAAIWLWLMLACGRSRGRAWDALKAIALGVMAGVLSTWILHEVLREMVSIDPMRMGDSSSMFANGIALGIPAGAVVGLAGAVLLAFAAPRRMETGSVAGQEVSPRDPEPKAG